MNEYDLWFSLVKISSITKLKLLKKFQTTEKIWYYSIRNKKSEYFYIEILEKLESAWNITQIHNLENKLKLLGVKTVFFHEDNYPKKLKFYEDSPFVLFYKGDIQDLNNRANVSIVGSRKCSNYGKDVTNMITKELCKNNINIISGMARGIDTLAHRGCTENNKYTCAVLGSGIDVIYPKDNTDLYNKILKNGSIITEFLPGTPPHAFNFPTRNRIISALSDLIIVVEAGCKSGSLITATIALEQGKDVMAVPGSVFSKESNGTNKLIKDGAYPLTDIDDIFDLIGIKRKKEENNDENDKKVVNNKIYNIINDNPIHIDEIIRMTNIDIKQLYKVLFEMQVKDEIMFLSGNYYVRVNKRI